MWMYISLVLRPTYFRRSAVPAGAEKGSGNIAIQFLYHYQDSGASNQVTERYSNTK